MVVSAGVGRGFAVALQSIIVDTYDDSTLFSNIFAMGSIANVAVSILIPVAVHYIRYKLLFIIILLLYVASAFSFSPEMVSSFWLYVLCTTWTIGATGTQILGGALLNVALPDGRRATYISVVNMVFNAFMVATPLLVGWLGYSHGSPLYRVYVSCCCSSLCFIERTPEP